MHDYLCVSNSTHAVDCASGRRRWRPVNIDSGGRHLDRSGRRTTHRVCVHLEAARSRRAYGRGIGEAPLRTDEAVRLPAAATAAGATLVVSRAAAGRQVRSMSTAWQRSAARETQQQKPLEIALKHTRHCRMTPSQLGFLYIKPLESRGNYSATSNDMKLAHWPLEGRERAGALPSNSLFVVPNVTAHPSTASVPISVYVI